MAVAGASRVVKASTRERSVQRHRDAVPSQNLPGGGRGGLGEAPQENNSRTPTAGHELTARYQRNAACGATRGAERLALRAEEH